VRRLALIPLLLALSGCGDAKRAPALAPVRLTLTAPADRASIEAESIEVRGTVAPPTARVLVAGAEAEVRGGEFSATVPLVAGANVIDVQAGAPRRPAAMAALRVTRLVPVEIPDVEGFEPGRAVAALEAIGLEADVREAGGLLDDFLPGTAGVCATDPDAGEEVSVGTTVVVVTAKSC
jgi:glucodextranase-like protein/PASTA domain-containing protein